MTEIYGTWERAKGPPESAWSLSPAQLTTVNLHTKKISFVEILWNKEVKIAISLAGGLSG